MSKEEPDWIDYAATEVARWIRDHEQVRAMIDEPTMFLYAAFRIGELIRSANEKTQT